jgi:hypothetical protein
MSVLKSQGRVIVLVVAVAACAVFAYFEWSAATSEPSELKALDQAVVLLQDHQRIGKPSPKYQYGAQAAADLKYDEDLKASLDKRQQAPAVEVPAYVAYPQPPRPFVDPGTEPIKPGADEQVVNAGAGQLSDLKAEGDHGRVFVTFRLPAKMEHMAPVRVEIYRGLGATVDTAKPYGVIELGPEDAPAAPAPTPAAAAAARTEEPAPAEAAPEVSTGAKRRAEREAAGPATPARGGHPEKVEEVPAELAGVKVFADTTVEPKKTYSYQAKLVVRMTVAPRTKIEIRNDPKYKYKVVDRPESLETVPPQKPDSQALLFTPGLSETVSAAPPANFQIRLAGTSGTVPPPGTPEHRLTKDYKGTFGVRVWVAEAQEWKEEMLNIAPDEALKGTITYRAKEGGEKSYDYDTGYKLLEIKYGETVTIRKVRRAKLDKDGNPVLSKTGQPIFEEVEVKGAAIPTEIAVLENTREKPPKLEEFPKASTFSEGKEAVRHYQRILDEQKKAEAKKEKPKTGRGGE